MPYPGLSMVSAFRRSSRPLLWTTAASLPASHRRRYGAQQGFFAHPYTAWERAQNERHNGLFRSFVPKGVSIELFTDEDIFAVTDELNGRPRKKLGHCIPEELFEVFRDTVYAA